MKDEALELADELLKRYDLLSVKSAFSIRELVKESEKKPLSIEEIEGAFYKKCWYYDEDEKFDYYGFAREIEERHGIK